MNIYEKLVEIRKSIKGFEKDASGYNYSYISGQQVLSKIASKMNELKVVLEPHVIHETSHYQIFEYDTVDRYNKTKHNIDYIVNAKMEYVWINAENPEEKVVVPWSMFGQQDEISKAFGSGLTYSERYFLLKYFGMQTDEDDPDSRQVPKEEEEKKNNKRGKGSNKANKEESETVPPTPPISDKIDNETLNSIQKLLEEKGKTEKDAIEYISAKYKIKLDSIKDMTPNMASQLQLKLAPKTEQIH